MYQDFSNFKKFYDTEIGINLKELVSSKIKKYVYLYENQTLGSFGFANPYLDFVKEKNIKILNFYSSQFGIKKNLIQNNSLNILHDEEKIPIEDLFFNHIFSIHYLENSNNLKKTLRELWRVLSPEGKIYLIIPNKKSSWSLSVNSPFSLGFGFSKKKIIHLLEENFYEIQFVERIVYFPYCTLKIICKNNLLIDKIGSRFWPFFNGFYLCVAQKRIYSTPSNYNLRLFGKTRVTNG